jgi:L-ascorbate metabolism protein UlaG (beta-lactamase superfamily)
LEPADAQVIKPAQNMRKPVFQDAAFLSDVKASARDDGRFRLWWLGQSGFLLASKGRFALLDPYLSDSLTKKYAGTDKPHVRITERVVDPAALDFINVTTSSHGHTDHQDPETLCALARANPVMPLVLPAATVALCCKRTGLPKRRLIPIDVGLTREIEPFTISAVASAHETLEYDEMGACKYLGYLLRFGGWTIYHSGDTVDYPGLAENVGRFNVDLAILPINGRGRGVPGNLSAEEAAHLARRMGARLAVPCHYGMFEFNTGDPTEFAKAAAACRQAYIILGVGARYESPDR